MSVVTVIKRVEVGQVADVPLPYSAKSEKFAPSSAVIEFVKGEGEAGYRLESVTLEGINRVKNGGLGNTPRVRAFWSTDTIQRDADLAAWLLPLIQANAVTAAEVAP